MDTNRKSISIFGCGWLGLPLAIRLRGLGWQVKGTTTSEERIGLLKSEGIISYLLKLPGLEYIKSGLFVSEVLLISIPPGRRKKSNLRNYESSVHEIITRAKKYGKAQKLIFISSTSVYSGRADIIRETSETDPESESGKVIRNAEKLIVTSGIPYIILRFGGLVGPDRHPGRFLSGKTGLTTGHQPVNLLHLDDAVGSILRILKCDFGNETFNVVAPVHPTKQDFYTKMAEAIDLPPPVFTGPSKDCKKEISVKKLMDLTDYSFLHPDPMNFNF
ncbi:MAG: SDR family NAD(P)-dependent oxidoreductase [Cytophagales bacterium]|nr:SDR family NAD(P)-dependent oxidoreductase [Cytophagales bacterium]